MWLITAAVFATTLAISYQLLSSVQEVRRRKQRLAAVATYHLREQETQKVVPQEERFLIRLLKKMSKLVPNRQSHKLELELQRADIPMKASEFVALNLVCGIFPWGLIFVGGRMLMGLTLSLGGLLLPQLYLKMRQTRRLKLFATQIPEALVMMANSLKAGYSFLQAMELVHREMSHPIASEFGKALKEMNLGKTTEEALQAMVERVNSDDLDLVITAVLIQRQVGGNLSEILDSIAFTIRERIRIKGEIQTLTAQGRISGMVIGALPVGLGVFIYLLNPGYVTPLFQHPLGKLLLIGGVVGQIVAVFVIKKIVTIQV